jgi:hypothetical protein
MLLYLFANKLFQFHSMGSEIIINYAENDKLFIGDDIL